MVAVKTCVNCGTGYVVGADHDCRPDAHDVVKVHDGEYQRCYLLVEFAKAALTGLCAEFHSQGALAKNHRGEAYTLEWASQIPKAAWMLAQAMVDAAPGAPPSGVFDEAAKDPTTDAE